MSQIQPEVLTAIALNSGDSNFRGFDFRCKDLRDANFRKVDLNCYRDQIWDKDE